MSFSTRLTAVLLATVLAVSPAVSCCAPGPGAATAPASVDARPGAAPGTDHHHGADSGHDTLAPPHAAAGSDEADGRSAAAGGMHATSPAGPPCHGTNAPATRDGADRQVHAASGTGTNTDDHTVPAACPDGCDSCQVAGATAVASASAGAAIAWAVEHDDTPDAAPPPGHAPHLVRPPPRYRAPAPPPLPPPAATPVQLGEYLRL